MKITNDKYEIVSNIPLTDDVFEIVLKGDTSNITRPGQFVNILIDGLYLRRPISICDYSMETITLIYKIVGEGTEVLSKYSIGDSLDLLVGLGNGFDIDNNSLNPLVIGGGVGIPPLFNLTKELIKKGKNPSVILCFNTKREAFYIDEFKKLIDKVFVATVDGSLGDKGFYSDVIAKNKLKFDYYYTCGPLPMLENIHNKLDVPGQLSFEERMGCGFGGCMGCTHKTKNGYKKICTNTILSSEEVLFD